jgi:hypothetical protein
VTETVTWSKWVMRSTSWLLKIQYLIPNWEAEAPPKSRRHEMATFLQVTQGKLCLSGFRRHAVNGLII